MKKLSFDSKFETLRFAVAILIAFVLSVVIILIVSGKPSLAIEKLFLGPLSSFRRFGNVLELAITLTFAGLSIAIIFSAKQFNMGPESAFYGSGAIAAMFAIAVPLPPGIAPIVSILLGGLVGALICVIPAIIKEKWGANEFVSSLMLNFIFLYFFRFFINGIFKDPDCGYNATFLIPKAAKLDIIIPRTRIHFGFYIVIAAVILCILFIKKTKLGFQLVQTGRNAKFAKYVGINTVGIIYMSQLVGGFVAGVGGAVEILGMYDRFRWQALPGYGFDGIIVSILAKNNPKFVPVAALLLAYLRIGADMMATSTDVTSEMISIIQAVIIMLVAAGAFLSNTRQKMLVREVRQNG